MPCLHDHFAPTYHTDYVPLTKGDRPDRRSGGRPGGPTLPAMTSRDVRRLLHKLNGPLTRALEAAAGFAVSRGHYEVSAEHLLLKLLETGEGDLPLILNRQGVDAGQAGRTLTDALDRMRTGNTGRPAFSPLLLGLVEEAWVVASVHHGQGHVRSGHLLEALLTSSSLSGSAAREAFSGVSAEALKERMGELTDGSEENRASARSADGTRLAPGGGSEGETALDLYTHPVTQHARDGRIDPVFGRDREIRQLTDVLMRRRKNNPILVGEAGVGKTAVVEGLALRIAHGDVPDALKDTEIVALDLGALQAGAGVKGEFEARLKSVIDEIQASPKPLILFIDEAHTLVGAGGQAGTGDAANLLKPALARGELRSIAATTWSEYKKHIEKDPALARRFQTVKVDEPSVPTAQVMMRGVAPKYEAHHGVHVTEEAVRATVELSHRYLSGRQLPDKSVDLLDTAAARVKMSQSAVPPALDDLTRRLHDVTSEAAVVRRDGAAGMAGGSKHDTRLQALDAERETLEAEVTSLRARWEAERALALELETARRQFVDGGASGEDGLPRSSGGVPSPDQLRAIESRLTAMQNGNPLVHAAVDEHVVARVIADWTGIPIGNMVKDEAATLLALQDTLRERVRGQDEGLGELSDSIRSAKAGLGKADAPQGVFLLVGPSGVGKTETARALAELLFGGERFMVSINMSEYQEGHTTSQLKGAPPGYVGYGEGGVLTEAVRQRPYSVVLLDEVEKAHIDVMEMFYQVFDRGILRDGEGREVDFSNTVILATSNVGSAAVQQACMADRPPSLDELRALIHAELAAHFQPALLARMRVIPFLSLDMEAMAEIVRLKLDKVDRRLRQAHGIRFEYPDEVVGTIAARCTTLDAGARNADFVIERSVLPQASRALLGRLATTGPDAELPDALLLGLDAQGDFTYRFSDSLPRPGGEPDPAAPTEPPTDNAPTPEMHPTDPIP